MLKMLKCKLAGYEHMVRYLDSKIEVINDEDEEQFECRVSILTDQKRRYEIKEIGGCASRTISRATDRVARIMRVQSVLNMNVGSL